MTIYQQGDVLIKESTVNLDDAEKVAARNGLFVLAEGEATGHKHAIESVAGVEFLEKDGLFYIVNKNPATVRHEEHGPITLPPGSWEIDGVREYDHFAEEARNVID